MYDQEFGTEWRTLSDEALIRRMYALGVSTALGAPNREEFERLRRQANTAYGRSLLQLSFEEGKQRVRNQRGDFDTKADAWEALVERDDDVEETGPSVGMLRPTDSAGIPSAVGRTSLLDIESDDLGRLRLPKFLRRK
ncbi:hypothetical protein ACFQJC_03490 [Haloferax namakaokahaiae]|uniref:Uncharacterized protein n=1 Tax=Haloferax namakaokahaiae TaxID=1748331 RepID=A0ABD5ZBH1_9EURY